MGPDGDSSVYVRDPALAYNGTTDQYLVVWAADAGGAALADDEFEIYGQLLAADGAAVGSHFRISSTGPDGDPDFDALNPVVVHNPDAAEYLVVWQGDGDGDPPADNAVQISGRRIDAAGTPIGSNGFQISDMGVTGDPAFRAQDPALIYNSTAQEYMVVWEGVDDTPGLAAGEVEVFGQRLSSNGNKIGVNDFRISDMGPNGDVAYAADNPAVAWNSLDNTYLVVWSGDDDGDFGSGPLADGEFEVYGQRLDGDGSEIGTNDFRISHMGTDGEPAYRTFGAEVAYVAGRAHYLVVWRGDDNRDFGATPLADDEMEIFGQILDSSGVPIGADLRLSDAGPDGDPSFDADRPAVAAQGSGGTAIVVWQGDDNAGAVVDGEVEVFAQLYAVQSMPNVSLTKSAAPGFVTPGQTVTYTLNFSNTGGELAAGVLLTDIVPAEVMDVNYVNGGAALTQTNAGVLTFTWMAEDLAPGATGTIVIGGVISPCLAGGYTFGNTALIATGVEDGYLGDNQDTAWLTVLNVPPVASDDGYATAQDQALTVPAASGVLVDDSDRNCDALTAILDSDPADGAIVLNLDGSFVYTPALSFAGSDAFTYHAHDGLADSNVSTVTLVVGDEIPPEVTAVHPLDGATDVAVDAGIVITFSEMMDTSTLSYTVTPGLGGESLMWASGDRVVNVDHTPFAYDTTYAVTVAAAADLTGNPLASAEYWSFSTAPVRLYMPIMLRRP